MTRTTYRVKPVQIECRDAFTLGATLFLPDTEPPGGVIIISAALGVGQNFYHHFAAFMCEKGFCAVTFDYLGTGDSKTGASHPPPALKDWAVQDIDAVIRYAATLPGTGRIFLAGHSVGGQIFCLAEQSENLCGVILVGASFPFWKRWPAPRKFLMYGFFHVLAPVLSVGSHFPAKMLGLSKENLPARLVGDWARWARDPDYVTAGRFGMDTQRFDALSVPMLSFGFSDDTYAPEKAVQRLHRAFRAAEIEANFIEARQSTYGPIGHFGFFRKGITPDLWEKTVAWMNRVV